jgi:plastocyanin
MCKLPLFLASSALMTLGTLGACGSSSTSVDAPPPAIDAAPPTVDAAPPGVAMEVDCTTAPTAPVVVTQGFNFSPVNTPIAAGSVVKFTMPAEHNVASATVGLAVDFSATKCLKFPTAGIYMFHCVPHGFVGTITVTAVTD